jgi:hypothetical protein
MEEWVMVPAQRDQRQSHGPAFGNPLSE